MIRYLLPLLVAATGWAWPADGYGVAPPWQATTNEVSIVDAGWHYDWSARCPEPNHIPMLYDGKRSYEWEWLAECNDGRPVLVLNEPEIVGEAELTPAETAVVLHRVVQAWRGEVWCCGWNIGHPGGIEHALATLDAYEDAYGTWAAGWHIHLYPSPDIATALARYDTFVAMLRERGVLGPGVIVSEYGAGWQEPVTTLRAWRKAFAERPEIVSAAWFLARGISSWHAAGSLVDGSGALTPVGVEWMP